MLFESIRTIYPRAMTLIPKLTKLLNEQINNEMASSYVYLAMAAWFEQTRFVLQAIGELRGVLAEDLARPRA